jgi:hypothetical protein
MSKNSLTPVLTALADAADPGQQDHRGELLKAMIVAQQGQKDHPGFRVALLRRDYPAAARVLTALGRVIREGKWQNALDQLRHTTKDQSRAALLSLFTAAAEGATVDALEAVLIRYHDAAELGYIRIDFGSAQAITITEQIIEAGRSPLPPTVKRPLLDDASQTVLLDGRAFVITDPTAYLFFKVIVDAQGAVVSPADFAGNRKLRSKRIGRYKSKWPRSLRAIIQAKAGRGHWLRLPPPK